jgi:hypothetical protein
MQVGIQLFLCWLLYFYTAAALRESVLRMNGSHIRPWWVAPPTCQPSCRLAQEYSTPTLVRLTVHAGAHTA